MKQIWVLFGLVFLVACKNSEKKTTEKKETGASLEQRIATFMDANDKMELDKVLDYTYPGLFDIVPKADLRKAMQQGFDNEELKMELDSMKVEKVYPSFTEGNGTYTKVDYSMLMIMTFKNEGTTGNDEATNNSIRATLAQKYGDENVTLDQATGTIRIREKSSMVAVKDDKSPDWTFVNIKAEEPMFGRLFSKEVIDKLSAVN